MHERGEDRQRLERQADELLTQSVRTTGRGEHPCYSERWMDILSERERAGVEELPAPPDPGEREAKLGAIVVDAQLSRQQRTVIRWVARGLSQRQIAGMLGISESQVSRLKSAAIERMRRVGECP